MYMRNQQGQIRKNQVKHLIQQKKVGLCLPFFHTKNIMFYPVFIADSFEILNFATGMIIYPFTYAKIVQTTFYREIPIFSSTFYISNSPLSTQARKTYWF